VSRLSLSREFRLVAACCRWPPSDARDQAVRALAGAEIDWPFFLDVARRHRVEGLASDALVRAAAPAPASVLASLAQEAAGIARENLQFTAESVRLLRLFDGAGIKLFFIKGVTLNILAYGTLGLKRSRDIDLAVPTADVEQGSALLKAIGYRRIAPGPEINDDQFRTWVKLSKETIWVHETSRIIVEMHNGLVDNPMLLPDVSIQSPQQMVPVAPSISLPTLRKEELFSYLCVHGATHAWSRLKWIADVAALLKDDDEAAVERIYRRSLELGVGRSSAQALLLCAELFEFPLAGALKAELEADAKTRWLVRVALGMMAGKHVKTELDDTVLGTLPIHLSHFLLGRGWRYKAAELKRKSLSPYDQATIPLPRPLAFLYPLLLVPSWIWRRATSRAA
jgi:hypothetical protein